MHRRELDWLDDWWRDVFVQVVRCSKKVAVRCQCWSAPNGQVTSAVGFGAACGDNICLQMLTSCLGTITMKVVGYFVRIIALVRKACGM